MSARTTTALTLATLTLTLSTAACTEFDELPDDIELDEARALETESARALALDTLDDPDSRLAIYEQLAALHPLELDPADPRAAAVSALERSSRGLLLRQREGHIVQAFGLPIGGIQLDEPTDVDAATLAARTFLRTNAQLFGLQAQQLGELDFDRSRQAQGLRLDFRQTHRGLRVIDGDFALGFDAYGYLTRLIGAPWGADRLPANTTPRVELHEAAAMAIEAAMTRWPKANARTTEAQPELVVRGADARLLWSVELEPVEADGLAATLLLDAQDGSVVEFSDDAEHGTQMIDVRRTVHSGGEDGSMTTAVGSINTDINDEVWVGNTLYCRYGLQRLGQGRARMWTGFSTSPTGTPDFDQVLSGWSPCSLGGTNYFSYASPNTYGGLFNAQTTFWWAQFLKTRVDIWGRYPNFYGHYPIDDPARRVNVEIVVNAPAEAEDHWCRGVTLDNLANAKNRAMHGCFRSQISSGWFDNHPLGSSTQVPVVFLYNDPLNSGSPQFHGTYQAPDYGIIIHEVGHYISWSYGGWSGPNDNMRISLNEGMSMVLPALFARDYWGNSVGYSEAEDVSTGSFIDGSQWREVQPGDSPLRYQDLDCEEADPYELAFPFVQAVWRMLHNQDHNGSPIWFNSVDAVDNTADLVMWALYNETANSSMTWTMLAFDLIYYMADRYRAQTEKGSFVNYGSMTAVYRLFQAHGLLSACQ